VFPPTASAAAYSEAVSTSESAVLQALRPPASIKLEMVVFHDPKIDNHLCLWLRNSSLRLINLD